MDDAEVAEPGTKGGEVIGPTLDLSPAPRKVRIGGTLGPKGRGDRASARPARSGCDAEAAVGAGDDDTGSSGGGLRSVANEVTALRQAFYVALAAGAVGAVVGTASTVSGPWGIVARIIGICVPLATIIVFHRHGRLKGWGERGDTRQRFADLCYFLGFIITMFAMLAGFLPAGLLGIKLTSGAILGHFSMALGATALGLIFRIVVLQSHQSSLEATATYEEELRSYVRSVTAEARTVAAELSELRKSLVADHHAFAAAQTAALQSVTTTAVKKLTDALEPISTSIQTQVSAAQKALEMLQTSIAVRQTEIATVATEVVSAQEGVGQALVDLDATVKALGAEIGGLAASTQGEVARAVQSVKQMTASLATIANAAAGTEHALKIVQNKGGMVASSLDTVQASLGAIAPKIDSLPAQVEGVVSRLQTATGAVERNFNAQASTITAELAVATTQLQAVLQKFAGQIQSLRDTPPANG